MPVQDAVNTDCHIVLSRHHLGGNVFNAQLDIDALHLFGENVDQIEARVHGLVVFPEFAHQPNVALVDGLVRLKIQVQRIEQ